MISHTITGKYSAQTKKKSISFSITRSDWYNNICHVYEALGDFYRQKRKAHIEELNISEGDTVVDICCGTGRNIEFLLSKVGKSGKIIALDISKGMLKKAKRKYKNENIIFLELDCQELTKSLLQQKNPSIRKIDHVICTLGLSVVSDMQKAFDCSFQILKPNGQYSILDLYYDKKTFVSRIIDFCAFANSSRISWNLLEQKGSNFSMNKSKFGRGIIVSAKATK